MPLAATSLSRRIAATLCLLLCLSVSASAQVRTGATWINGFWIGGEADGDDYDLLINCQAGVATVKARPGAKSTEQVQYQIDATRAPSFTLHSSGGDAATLLLVARNEGYLWKNGNGKNKLLRVRRLGKFPLELEGTWQADGAPAADALLLHLSPRKGARTDEKGVASAVSVYPLSRTGATVELILAKPGSEGRLCHFVKLPSGKWLFWLAEESDSMVLKKVANRDIKTPAK